MDKFLLIIGTISAIGTGAMIPIVAVYLGDISEAFDQYNEVEDRRQIIIDVTRKLAMLAFFIWISGYLYFALWQLVAEKITFDLRLRFLKTMLSQEVGFFEEIKIEQLPSSVGQKFLVIQESIGFCNHCINQGADMVLICLTVFPLAIVLIMIIGGQVKKSTNFSTEKSNIVGGKIEESLQSIKVISSFAQEDREIIDFNIKAEAARTSTIKSEYITAAFIGTLKLAIYGSYGFNFWMATVYLDQGVPKCKGKHLENTNFEIKTNTTTAIVGASGSGKSTIIQLIERFYDPQQGFIKFGDVKLQDISLETLRESIGYVQQEPVLILGTIRDNILLGNKDANEEDIKKSLEIANANFVYDLENKLDTYIGSSSLINLSGGQKQRIAIARALIKKPKILILDEATSALDPKSEKDVQQALYNIQNSENSLTTIVIAHRLQTIQSAENLIYFNKNRLIQTAQKGTEEFEQILQDLNKNQTFEGIMDEIQILKNQNQQFDNIEKNTQFLEDQEKFPRLNTDRDIESSQLIEQVSIPLAIEEVDDRLTVATGLLDFITRALHKHLGENLSCAIRTKLYSTIVKKNLSWFDRKDRAPGILISIFSEDITALNGLTGETISNILEAILTLVIGGLIALFYHWKMALISIATAPFIMFAGVILQLVIWDRTKSSSQSGKDSAVLDPYDKSNALVSDILMNYKTVISFGPKNIEKLLQKYASLLEEPMKKGHRSSHLSGLMFGYFQCIRFFFFAGNFYLSTIFIFDQNDDPEQTYIAIYTVMMAAFAAGGALSLVPSFSKSIQAANKIFGIIKDESSSKITQQNKQNPQDDVIQNGSIEFNSINFKYPSRQQWVLKNLSFKIRAGMKVAIVGHSGSGKSTIASLILRIIKDNIIYGNRNATNKQIKEAAKLANCLHFIEQDQQEDSNESTLNKKLNNLINSKEFQSRYSNKLKEQVSLLSEDTLTVLNDGYRNLIVDVLKSVDDCDQIKMIEDDFERFKQVVQIFCQSNERNWVDVIHGISFLSKITKPFKEQIDFLHQEQKSENFMSISEHNGSVKQPNLNNNQSNENSFDNEYYRQEIIKKYQKNLPEMAQLMKLSQEKISQKIDNQQQKFVKSDDCQDQLVLYNSDSLLQESQNNDNEQLHEGFNKICGLQGAMLSGGQKQRIAIARALIKNPKILILDEATSALDKAMEGRTSIIIAHRLSTIRNCEWILVMHQGQIIEQGTFNSLSEDNQSYFYKLKSGMEM
ncbi:abc transporter [Stylonychia lemnae]|uniref:Abc transporter n=1 Tax=Stylonychia lemnae TaxID=5949 RepID=A0A078AYX5_STYLE|nr:abc transporter [Stylonychia lemnae]|eukprot:CDW87364.1 abc transporter [Stylonychia lemnae]